MMTTGRAVSAREIAAALQEQYPSTQVDIRAIYRCLRNITRSHFVVCDVDKTDGLHCKYRLNAISDDFFRKNKAIKRERLEFWLSLQVSARERHERSDEKCYRVLSLLREIDNEKRAARTGAAIEG